jgi:O-antigen/teichoic acid export membrane protein
VSRTRKAGILAIFGYAQFALGFVSGIVLIPLILKKVGAQNYGLWLACGDLLAYSAMIDIGVLNILPWIIAERDGRKDRDAIKKLIGNGLAVATIIGAVYFSIAIALWNFAASLANLDQSQRAMMSGPILFLIIGTAISFPMRTFYSALMGLQDVLFSGIVSVAQWTLNICMVLFMLIKGYGLYALAASAIVPTLAASIACLIRLGAIAPDLLRGWGRPSFSSVSYLTKEGVGAWLGSFGWRMVSASNSIIIVSIGSAELAVIYACTAKLGEVLMQMAWMLPDSGLLGLAQLAGEGRPERVSEVVLSMLRMLLITAGGVACVILFFNPNFVSLWVGPEKFGGFALNAFLAANVIGLSLTHGLIVPAAVLGSRLQAGVLTLAQGGAYLMIAVPLGHFFGLPGVAAANVIISFALAIPVGIRILYKRAQLSSSDLWKEAIAPWLARISIFLIAGAAIGRLMPARIMWATLALAPAIGVLYIWHMRPLYKELPLPSVVKPFLIKMRLIPQGN